MVGHDVETVTDARARGRGRRDRARRRGIWGRRRPRPDAVRDATFTVHAGEIVAVAGVSGNGQRELSEAIAGLGRVEGAIIGGAKRRAAIRAPRSRQAWASYPRTAWAPASPRACRSP